MFELVAKFGASARSRFAQHLILVSLAGGWAAASPRAVQADDWPQWLGPQRDSLWRETGIVATIPETGLRERWRTPVQGGYSGPAVAQHRVYLMDYVTAGDQSPNPDKRNQLEGTERVLCLDSLTGKEIWRHEYPCSYEISYPAGPRATPTVDGERVYTLGAEGDLRCLQAATGELLWAKNFKKDYQAKTPLWGFCGHPLVDGEKLIAIVGGPGSLVVAWDKVTGKEIYRALDAPDPGYSAPTIREHQGVRQLLIWHSSALVSANPDTGEAYWSEPFDPNYGMAIVPPRWSGDLLFIGGIVNKNMMLRLDANKPAAQVAWVGKKDIGIDPVHSPPFAEEGLLFGVTREGAISAVKMDNGQVLWSTFALMPDNRRAQSGTVYFVKQADRFFLFSDSGELVIARLSADHYQPLSRTKIIEPTGDAFGRKVAWSHPAFAEKSIFVRNDREVICYSLNANDYAADPAPAP